MTDLVKTYNPATAGTLTEEQKKALQDLTDAEIKELAVAYPNVTMVRAYLLIIDKSKPAGKQIPNLSSFENLWNLRNKNNMKNFVAFDFKGSYKPANINPRSGRKVEIVDLSETELLHLPGFKKPALPDPNGEELIVKKTKVNRKAKTE
jgi:hypothetical protein